MSGRVNHINFTISSNNILNGVKTVLSIVKPAWDHDRVQFKVFTEGISNQLMGCFYAAEPPGLLVRVYGVGTELFIDREAEILTMRALSQADQGPELLATFENGVIYEYIPGEVLTTQTVTDPEMWPLVAARLAQFHKLPIANSEPPILWRKLRHFVKLISDSVFSDSRYIGLKSLFFDKAALSAELDWVAAKLEKSDNPVVFCHNDLLLANLVVNPTRDSVTFIDYEYAGTNYQAFDIANHFNEYAGVDDIDFDRIPSAEKQQDWLRVYLRNYTTTPSPTDDQVRILSKQVSTFLPVSHLFWGIWSLVQSMHSEIEFDFIQYAVIKLNYYFRVKPLID